jgi:hypothetical protein
MRTPKRPRKNTEKIEYAVIRAQVLDRIGERQFNDLLRHIKHAKVGLWGLYKGRRFVEDQLVLWLYHDLFDKGYTLIEKTVRLPYKTSHKSLDHNAKVLRLAGEQWGRSKVVLGNLEEWQKSMRGVHWDKEKMPKLCLWMDSTDLVREKTKGTSTKDFDYSFKENGPGGRYMILMDGKSRIRKMWAGYEPKIWDGGFIKVTKDWLSEYLAGAGVADHHFAWAYQHVPTAEWYVPEIEPKPKNSEVVAPAVKRVQRWNRAVRAVRARVEHPFGEIDRTWEILREPWQEDQFQLDALAWVAIGVHNMKRA